MPSIRGAPSRSGDPRSSSGGRKAPSRDTDRNKRASRKSRLKKYNKQLRSSALNSNRLLGIGTLIPKEITISYEYRQLITFTTSGHSTAPGGMYSPTLVKINLVDPCQQVGPSSSGIVTVINYAGSTVQPVFHTLNPEANLQTQIQEYSDLYSKFVVTGSKSRVRVQCVANQHKLNPFPTNVPGQGTNTEGNSYGSNYMPHITMSQPTLDGELYVWSVKQRSEGQLVTNNTGLNLNDIRTKVPGIKMKKMNAYQNGTSSKAVIHKQTYSPKYLGIKDWRDNLGLVEFHPDGQSRVGGENCFAYLGITNRVPSNAALEPARVFMDVAVTYNVRFLQRKNDPASGDAPLPAAAHTEF